ncbi:ROK family protein [Actinoplanes sp. NBC_00393]|uniref:ROK family protein n=1 Tax=Actinoplanes sp. NBC_00393 TaxID=2975953 RepID=UPI002E1AC174
MSTSSLVAAVDIGGTKIAAALVDEAGVIRDRVQVSTPSGASAILCVIAELVDGLRAHAAPLALGVGAPGVIDSSAGEVRSATEIVPGWAGTPIRAELAGRLGLPVAVVNDVRAAALGAVRDPALRDCPDVLHVSVGTGVGGALIRNGRLVAGPHGSAGEIAHLLVPQRGALACGCGRDDHLEAVAAGPAIAAFHSRATGSAALPLTEVAARMRAGDEDAGVAIRSAGRTLGRALAGLVAAVDVDAVTLGGGVVHGIPEFAVTVGEAYRAEALPPLRSVPVLVSQAGPDAPLLGAAQLARTLVPEAAS